MSADDLVDLNYRTIEPVIGFEILRGDHFFGLIGEAWTGQTVSFSLTANRHAPGLEIPRLVGHPMYKASDLVKAIVDEAWRANIRPTAHLAENDAQMRHLEDMRKITFKKLGIEP